MPEVPFHVPHADCEWQWVRYNVYHCTGCGLWWQPNPGVFTTEEPTP